MEELHNKILSKLLEFKKVHKDFKFYTSNTDNSNSHISMKMGQIER